MGAPHKKMIFSIKKKYAINLLIFLLYFSFIIGFVLDENSAGGGSYEGDITWIWKNFEIFKSNDLIDSINHPDFFGNRTPLHYILHTLFNPYIFSIDSYRTSVFIISLSGPVIFYFFLKKKFETLDKQLLILISSILLLSPYYRTTAYWGLEENYGLISALLSFLFITCFLKERNENKQIKYFYLFLTIIFSSSCVYFDQKLLLIPIVCLIKIITSKTNIKFITFALITYFILSLPFIYLIINWGGIVPPTTQEGNPNTITSFSRLTKLYFPHVGYATTIIAFYLFPFLFFKNENLIILIKKFLLDKKNYYKISIFFIYLFYLIFYFDFKEFTVEKYWIGLGLFHKVSIILFNNYLLQEIFTYFVFFISWIIILIFIDKNYKDFLIIIYFYILSLLLWPLMQEYFDPIITLSIFMIFTSKLFISYKNTIFLITYLSIFLICSNIYYIIILSQ